MNAHQQLMQYYSSAYACAKATGLPYRTVKQWWAKGCFTDPARWVALAGADLLTLARLAADYRIAHPDYDDQG